MELVIDDTTENMTYWLQRPYLNEATKSLIIDKEVLIVPEEDFRPYRTPLFPSNLISLYDELKKYLQVEVAINDEDYHELSLNARVHRYGKFIVVAIVVPTFVTVLGNYISDKLKYEDSKDEIQLEIVVQGYNGESKSIKYKGTANNFNNVAEKVKEIAKEQSNGHREDTTNTSLPNKK